MYDKDLIKNISTLNNTLIVKYVSVRNIYTKICNLVQGKSVRLRDNFPFHGKYGREIQYTPPVNVFV